MKDPISVGLGEQVISRDPEDVLVAYGLGSCLGISMVDPSLRIAGLLHAVLPHWSNGMEPLDPASSKYVDSGIERLLATLIKEGANKNRLIVRIAGGANMLTSPGLKNSFEIGTRNIEAARQTFARINMTIKAEAVGGNIGRTVRFYVVDNRLTVRVIGEKEKEI
ncbi:MAG: chemotaxis protein CheD [Chloroflexi bacterium]|nr:chemotaxis protein CheD [Chloroflexota bacterium]